MEEKRAGRDALGQVGHTDTAARTAALQEQLSALTRPHTVQMPSLTLRTTNALGFAVLVGVKLAAKTGLLVDVPKATVKSPLAPARCVQLPGSMPARRPAEEHLTCSWAFGIWALLFVLQGAGTVFQLLPHGYNPPPDAAKQRIVNSIGVCSSGSSNAALLVQTPDIAQAVCRVRLAGGLVCAGPAGAGLPQPQQDRSLGRSGSPLRGAARLFLDPAAPVQVRWAGCKQQGYKTAALSGCWLQAQGAARLAIQCAALCPLLPHNDCECCLAQLSDGHEHRCPAGCLWHQATRRRHSCRGGRVRHLRRYSLRIHDLHSTLQLVLTSVARAAHYPDHCRRVCGAPLPRLSLRSDAAVEQRGTVRPPAVCADPHRGTCLHGGLLPHIPRFSAQATAQPHHGARRHATAAQRRRAQL